MSSPRTKLALVLASALAGALLAGSAGATTYSDDFQGATASLQWTALNDACLTAGSGAGTIPACSSMTWMNGQGYTIPASDTQPGQGALLLTPPRDDQTGAILSAFPPFPMSQGLQVTFTTYTYGGDSGGLSHDGADGIVFFLTDGTQAAPSKAGAEGGSMGYDCSNDNGVFDGIAYGYLGLGIDEFGNFLNTGDNGTNPQDGRNAAKVNGGVYNTNNPNNTANYKVVPPPNGTNSYYSANGGSIGAGTGPEYQPQRIGLRGAGNTNWLGLQALNPTYYSGSPSTSKVQAACSSGYYVASGNGSSKSPYVYQQLLYPGTSIPYNYNAIPGGYAVLPDSEPIANESAKALNPASGQPTPWPITYKLTISPTGLLNFAYSYNNGAFQPVLSNFNIATANGPIPASLRFGFSAGTGGDNNVHEITCFTASPLQSNTSVAGNTVTGKVQGAVQFFFASYSQNNWWGSLVADPLVIDSSGNLDIGTAANWDAKCVLTGNGQGGTAPCDSMTEADGTDPTGIYESPSQRTLLTSSALGAGDGVTLAWNSLSTAEQDALNVPNPTNPQDATPGQNRLAWLQGYRNVEQLYGGNSTSTPPVPACSSTPVASPPCDLRARTYVLGDIINSSPTFVGAPPAGSQPDVFTDKFDGAADPDPEDANGAQKYSTFAANNLQRLNVVYVGSNDGFVHGFEAGADNADGSFNSSDNDGKEVVAYMPYDVLMDKAVNLSSPLYQHDYLVDATPGVGDVFYGGVWHTWLVGGVGSTGDEIYALDVTNPASMTAADVIGDWDSTSAALDDANGVNHLGATVGTPTIARMHNGDWAFIFGSGLQPAPVAGAPAEPTEGVYIGLIDPTTGSVSFKFLDTGQEPTGSSSCTVPQPPPPSGTTAPPPVVCPGGIAYVTWVDLDGDGIADYLYAGDTQGRVWRFDVTSSNPANWTVSDFGTGQPTPLFVAKDAAGNPQPITTSILSLEVTTGLVTREMLFFGTGQEIQQSSTASTTYAKNTQTFYGIWDWNMGKWNAKSTTAFAALTGSQVPSQPFTRADLLVQTATQASPTAPRILSTTATVCWTGDAPSESCPTPNQYGWLFDLPNPGPSSGTLQGQQEQIVYNPTFIGGAAVVNTAIPPTISAAQCNPGIQTGFTMAFNPATGGAFTQPFFPNGGNGVMLNGVGTPAVLLFGGTSGIVTQTTGAGQGGGAGGTVAGGGNHKYQPYTPTPGSSPARVSWRELVNP